jgi:amino acid transporter
MFAYIIAAIPLIPATFSIVELTTAMPRAGGVYYYLDRSLGPVFGTIGGIGTWFALILKVAFALIGMGAYLALFFPQIEIIPVAIFIAVCLGILNVAGSQSSGKFQMILVIGLLIILAGRFKIRLHLGNRCNGLYKLCWCYFSGQYF